MIRKICVQCCVLSVLVLPMFAQRQHHHAVQSQATLEANVSQDQTRMKVRVGPVDLPANSTHDQVAQPAATYFKSPIDGWITAYHPTLTDEKGNNEPNNLLHHVAFHNTARSDFLCPNKQEHIFGAGGEMNDWPAVPGFGYRVHKGDAIRIDLMFGNSTAQSYPNTYFNVEIEMIPAATGASLKSVYPSWFDVTECGDSDYDLVAGASTKSGTVKIPADGLLLGVGGHLHNYGRKLVLEDTTQKTDVATLNAKLDAEGHVVSMPIVLFMDRGGFPVRKGDEMKTTATYDNPTGRELKDGAMGIVVGYFLPADPKAMDAFERKSSAPDAK